MKRWQMIRKAQSEKRALSVGLVGNAADIYPEIAKARHRAGRRHRPDLGA